MVKSAIKCLDSLAAFGLWLQQQWREIVNVVFFSETMNARWSL